MIHSSILDYGLFRLVQVTTRLVILATEPTDYPTATDAVNLIGEKIPPIVAGPEDAIPTGRRVVVQEITDGVVKLDATAAFWGLVDDNVMILLASGALAQEMPVSVNNAFHLSAFAIMFPGVTPPEPPP
jgi:hypothetical protein